MAIPKNFEIFQTSSPFIGSIGPLYHCEDQGGFVLGLQVQAQHCNTGGRLHGAMVCAIADIALGRNIGLDIYRRSSAAEREAQAVNGIGLVTTGLSVDFVGTARVGQWVETRVDVQRTGRSMGFANAYLVCDDQRIARASGVFKILRDQVAPASR